MIIRVDDSGTLKTFNILDGSVIADTFDATESYSIGDYVMYGNTLYRFTSAHSGAWASADVTAVNVVDEVSDVKGQLDEKITAPSSPATGAFLVWNGSAWVAQSLSTWQGGNY